MSAIMSGVQVRLERWHIMWEQRAWTVFAVTFCQYFETSDKQQPP